MSDIALRTQIRSIYLHMIMNVSDMIVDDHDHVWELPEDLEGRYLEAPSGE